MVQGFAVTESDLKSTQEQCDIETNSESCDNTELTGLDDEVECPSVWCISMNGLLPLVSVLDGAKPVLFTIMAAEAEWNNNQSCNVGDRVTWHDKHFIALIYRPLLLVCTC